MSKVYLVWPDGEHCELCTTPFHKWLEIKNFSPETSNPWGNYRKHLEDNNLHLITDFDLSCSDGWLEVGHD